MKNTSKTAESDSADAMTWEETDEVVEAEVKQPLAKIVPVRLTPAKWQALRREARELGIGPSTLARMWILDRLRQTTGSNPPS